MKGGGAHALIHHGKKKSTHIQAGFEFGTYGYACGFEGTNDNTLIFIAEEFLTPDQIQAGNLLPGTGPNAVTQPHSETRLAQKTSDDRQQQNLYALLSGIRTYHFHDTSVTSPIRFPCSIHENRYLLPDGSNIAAYLYLLQKNYPSHLSYIEDVIALIAPFFSTFSLRPDPVQKDQISLEWKEKDSDYTFQAFQMPDGLLRFICLATLLLQPIEMLPPIIIIDEPELGLHPFAITLLAEMIHSIKEQSQILITTQSVMLLDHFSLDTIRIVDRMNGSTTIHIPDPDELKEWLDDYSLGELWQKNLLGGLPVRGPYL